LKKVPDTGEENQLSEKWKRPSKVYPVSIPSNLPGA
jgi:hypothetical protein